MLETNVCSMEKQVISPLSNKVPISSPDLRGRAILDVKHAISPGQNIAFPKHQTSINTDKIRLCSMF